MLRLEWLPVHLVGDKDLGADRLADWEAAGVRLLLVALDPAVAAAKHDFDCVGLEAGVLEQPPERRAGPLGSGDRLTEPRQADGARVQPAASVPGALERDGDGLPRARSNLLERQLQRLPDTPPDAEPP